MSIREELLDSIDRILRSPQPDEDLQWLRQILGRISASSNRSVAINKDVNGATIVTGDGNIIVSITFQANGLRIGEVVRSLLQDTLQLKVMIDWQQVSKDLLNEYIKRLTSNSLTHTEGIAYRTEQVYVPLGLLERRRKSRREEDVSPEQGSSLYEETEITQEFEHHEFLEQVLKQGKSPRSNGRRIVVIGEPGAGKTTLLQKIARWILDSVDGSIVIWVSLAELNGHSLEQYLFERWLQAVVHHQGRTEASTQINDDFVAQFNQQRVWLLLDGADEMQVSAGNPLSEIDRQIHTGVLLQQARIVLSCRLNLWDSGSNALDSFDNYRTLEFSYPQQVEKFISNWFRFLTSVKKGADQELCAVLKESGKERIQDLVRNPLRLTLLCFNWYLGEGKLPETKTKLYEQFAADFYEWKKDIFVTTMEQRRRLNKALGELARDAIDKEAMKFWLRPEFVSEYLGEPDDANSLFYLALRLGWLNKVGVEAGNPNKGVYAFFHPTFQEYFAAQSLLDKLPEVSDKLFQKKYLNHFKWTEVVALMLAVLEDEKKVVQVVSLALDVDLFLGARLAGEVSHQFQNQTIECLERYFISKSVNELGAIELLKQANFESMIFTSDVVSRNQAFDRDNIEKPKHKWGGGVEQQLINDLFLNLNNKCSNARQSITKITEDMGSDEAVQSILNVMLESNFIMRIAENAVNSSGYSNRDNIDEVISSLHSQASKISEDAVNAQVEINLMQTTDELVKALNNIDPIIRCKAAIALGNIKNNEAIEGLLIALQDKDPNVRWRVVKSLGEMEMDKNRVTGGLIGALLDENYKVRVNAAMSLEKICSASSLSCIWEAWGKKPEWFLKVTINSIQAFHKYYNYELYNSL
jgi:HEAT repeat protein